VWEAFLSACSGRLFVGLLGSVPLFAWAAWERLKWKKRLLKKKLHFGFKADNICICYDMIRQKIGRTASCKFLEN
jgi:hypothetical protein